MEASARALERSPLPIFCDEGCQRLTDIERIKDSFTGINIKLMKSTGLFEAKLMLTRARELGLQTLIGCMTETSCATMAAAALAPQFDYVDIDGPWMLAEQPFLAPDLKDGRLVLGRQAGLGIHPIHPSTFF
ncbi:MAG: enolase C-terminal domain-like protein [Bacteroidota bacterium]